MIIDSLSKSLSLTQQYKISKDLGLEKKVWVNSILKRWLQKINLKNQSYILYF